MERQRMDLFADKIQPLPSAEKLRLIEQIWDDLVSQEAPFPLPDWAVEEAARRRAEMIADPHLGSTHADIWSRLSATRDA